MLNLSSKKSRPRGPGGPSTRQRLIAATIDIVRSEGLGSLTTVEITRRAGIAQPGLYKHFRNVDEILEAATTQVLDGMNETFSAMRRGIQNRTDPEELSRHFLDVLDAVAADRPFNELIIRYRRDPSTLGRAIRDVEGRILTDFVDELGAQIYGVGFTDQQRPRLMLLAELALRSLGACIERVVDDEDTDRAVLARNLAEFTIGGTRAALGRMLGKKTRAPRSGS